ncbi:hypothetical protein IL306_014415 [Fusarium sp. DS 682]|nr:hypothetical protein IL306_014415 [Fusarium sp. DS 682]
MSIGGYLAPDQVALGRLVLRPSSPGQDYCPYAPVSLEESDVSKRSFASIEMLLGQHSDSRYRLNLTRMLSGGKTRSHKTADYMQSSKATVYQLLNSELYFEKLTQDEKTRKWLERFLSRTDVYLVVGLHTIESAEVNAASTSVHQNDISAHIPVTQVATAAGVPLRNALDVQMSAESTKGNDTAASFVAPGERIVRVEYRKIRFRRFYSRDANHAQLQSASRWKTYTTSRGTAGPDGVEVGLEELNIYYDVEDKRA